MTESDSDYSETDYGSSSDDGDEDSPAAPAGPSAPRQRPGVPSLGLPGGAAAAAAGGSSSTSSRPAVPRLGVSPLSLGGQQQQQRLDGAATSRGKQPAIPALCLGQQQQRAAGGRGPAMVPSLSLGGQRNQASPFEQQHQYQQQHQTGDVATAGAGVTAHLVSFAFGLGEAADDAGGTASLAAVRGRFVKALGVAGEDLRLFEIRELSGEALPAGCGAVGVAINKSGTWGVACARPVLLAAVEPSVACTRVLHARVRELTVCSRPSTRFLAGRARSAHGRQQAPVFCSRAK